MILASASLIGAPNALIIFVTWACHKAAVRNGEVPAPRRGGPRPAAVARHFDRVDTVAAVPGDAPDANRSHPHTCAIYGIGDQRVHHDLGDWRIDCRFLGGEARDQRKPAERDAIGGLHPESGFRLGYRLDRCDVLHPISAGPAR